MPISHSVFEEVYVVAKFYKSKAPSGDMGFISRSLGKLAVIDKQYHGMVQEREIWICQIVKETRTGENNGVFVLRPVERIESDQIRKVIPGFYEVQQIGKAALISPNTDPDAKWILSRSTRRMFAKKYHAVIVPIRYQEKQEKVAANG